MSRIKGVIISIEDTLLPKGKVDRVTFDEVTKLIAFFKKRNIDFVVYTNRNWTFNNRKMKDVLFERWGSFTYLSRYDDASIPAKPRAEAIRYVLNLKGWANNETLYIGASESDMQTAVNGKLLFLRATWWANKTDYGFEFDSPKDIARFVDTFCLRSHLWCHEIHDGDFNFFALAPYSTMKAEYTFYSEDARNAAKHGSGHPDFWLGALISSLYFSNVHNEVDYICVYPGHKSGAGNEIMNDAITIFGNCFRKAYIKDLIVRHTTAIKSQKARNSGMEIDHLNQLNTINLNPYPRRANGVAYKNNPLRKNKTVLLIDDITTRGYSLESARAYIEQTGAKVIMASWLKTVNTDIAQLGFLGNFNPYVANTFLKAPVEKIHRYRDNIVNVMAPVELNNILKGYENWDWP